MTAVVTYTSDVKLKTRLYPIKIPHKDYKSWMYACKVIMTKVHAVEMSAQQNEEERIYLLELRFESASVRKVVETKTDRGREVLKKLKSKVSVNPSNEDKLLLTIQGYLAKTQNVETQNWKVLNQEQDDGWMQMLTKMSATMFNFWIAMDNAKDGNPEDLEWNPFYEEKINHDQIINILEQYYDKVNIPTGGFELETTVDEKILE